MNVIINYNVGNLYNLKNALDFSGIKNKLVSHPEEILMADRILLPGVGAFSVAIQELKKSGMLEAIQEKIMAGNPLLGICVGAQLLMDESEENGKNAGIGLISGNVKRFNHNLKIPQIGWNQVVQKKKDPLFEGIPDNNHFYFVHSYHILPNKNENFLGVSNYGYDFVSAIRKDNIWGVQFHPEKSQNPGLMLLKNFCKII